MRATEAEVKQTMAGIAWWRQYMPAGWSLYGLTDRVRASFVSPSGRLVEVDGELLAAMTEAQPHAN